jgi:hypothetical protein
MTKYKYTRKREKGKGCRVVLFIFLGIISLCVLSWTISFVFDWDTFKAFTQNVYQFVLVGNVEAFKKNREESDQIDTLKDHLESEYPGDKIYAYLVPTISEEEPSDYVYAIYIVLINPDFLGDRNPSDVIDTVQLIAEDVHGNFDNIDEYESIFIKVTKKTNLIISRTEVSSTYGFRVNDLGND